MVHGGLQQQVSDKAFPSNLPSLTVSWLGPGPKLLRFLLDQASGLQPCPFSFHIDSNQISSSYPAIIDYWAVTLEHTQNRIASDFIRQYMDKTKPTVILCLSAKMHELLSSKQAFLIKPRARRVIKPERYHDNDDSDDDADADSGRKDDNEGGGDGSSSSETDYDSDNESKDGSDGDDETEWRELQERERFEI